MKNRDIYLKKPTGKLINEGVASVNDLKESVLRYELDTFVCDGQYAKGMELIIETFLNNIEEQQQPAVWVSGFFGSGKSHLVKMLQALWQNTEFSDGATARGIANLPSNVQDLLKELSTEAKRYGGLHSTSGTLKANDDTNSVRLALLAIIFKSVGLPAKYHHADFVMWLKEEGIYKQVREQIESSGRDWDSEIKKIHVSKLIRESLVKAKPDTFYDEKSCAETLVNQFPQAEDISNDDMVEAIQKALTQNGKFPLTLIVLDEVQQYIGEDLQRSIDVQEAVEAISKQIGGKVLFIGTGQTAVTGTSNLKKLEGRFTIRVELSDTDVDAVIRKVILAKKPEAIKEIDRIMQTNLGEVSRHLSNTTIGHQQEDIKLFAQDYPILPVRRRFWENTLRVLDQTGTDSQLRNQLSMVHSAINTNLDGTIGDVLPADYLYFDSVDKLLQARELPRTIYDKTMRWIKGTDEEQLMARATGLVFLINKVSDKNSEIGLKATSDSIADLMIQYLPKGSSELRSKLPSMLDSCELLMKVGDEYRIQTEESTAWNDEFLKHRGVLNNETSRIEAERDDRIKHNFGRMVTKHNLMQGHSRVSRDMLFVFNSTLPTDASEKMYVWVRDGWSSDENSVKAEARQAGSNSPTIYVFIPKRSADDIRHNLIDFKAASLTLEIRGVPTGPEGKEARAAMQTRMELAEGKINELINESLSGARVFQGGGNEIPGSDLQAMINEAGEKSLLRLYPDFQIADNPGWEKVYSKAKQGAPDALKAVGDSGEVVNNPVCKTVLSMIGGGKSGMEIRTHFEHPPFGWPRDAIDGSLQVLLNAGLVRAQDERGLAIDPKDLERKAIGKTQFKVESTSITTLQKLQIRKLFQKMDLSAISGSELILVPQFLQKLHDLAERAGGEAPKPQKPKTLFLEQISLKSGNEQLLAIFDARDKITDAIASWKDLANRIEKRYPAWEKLKKLAEHAESLDKAKQVIAQIENIENERRLLEETDLIPPLKKELSQLLRDELNTLNNNFQNHWDAGEKKLDNDANWAKLTPEQRHQLRAQQQLIGASKPEVDVTTSEKMIYTLDQLPLSAFSDRVAALPGRFNNVLLGAAQMLEPEAQEFTMPSRTLKTEQDIDSWLKELEKQLKAEIKKGPLIIR